MNVIYGVTWWVLAIGVIVLDRGAWRKAPAPAVYPEGGPTIEPMPAAAVTSPLRS